VFRRSGLLRVSVETAPSVWSRTEVGMPRP
jgi:hypothetical protein